MFLFKITLPLLGTATLGAVGTGIYYGVESWKNNSTKTKQARENGKGGSEEESASSQEDQQKQESPPDSSDETESDAEDSSENTSELSPPNLHDSTLETQRPLSQTVTVHLETDTEETK